MQSFAQVKNGAGSRSRRKLMLMSATILSVVAMPAYAQEQAVPAEGTQLAQNTVGQPSPQSPSTTTQGAAETPGFSESGAEDIVVTAQFREQNLQQTPLAITAITGEQLQAKGIVNMQDLTKVAPSVNLRHTGSAGGKTLAAFIRGIGASDYNFNVEPGVAFYIDDVYLGPSYGTLLDFIDLERAEVLRGPQGTLSGKNALGGAVRLVTVKPRGQNTGYVELETGSRQLLRMRAAYDLSLVPDTLFMRVSGYSARQNGLVKLYDFGCVNPTLVGNTAAPYTIRDSAPGQDCQRGELGDVDVRAARLQFRWTPNADVEVNLAGSYVDDNANGAADVLTFLNPAGFATYRSPAQIAAGITTPYYEYYYGVPYDQRFLPPDRYSSYSTFEDKVYNLKFPNQNNMVAKDVMLSVDWGITPELSLTSITAYRDINGVWSYDSDSSPLATDGVVDRQGHEQFSQEVRLSGSLLDDRLNFTLGGFYYTADQIDDGSIEANIFNFFITVNSTAKQTNYAGFLHTEFNVTDQLSLIGAIRQTHEEKTYHFIEIDTPGTPGSAFPGGLDVPAQTKYNRTDYRIGAQFQIDPLHMVYANVATGFRGGGFNPRPSNLQTVVAFAPESQTTYEVGQRSQFLDRRVRWNNTFYYSEFQDIILSGRITSITPGGSFPVNVPTNAAKAHIYGWESELSADVSDYLNISAGASYTKFKYDDLGPAQILAATTGATLDSNQRYTPKWKFNIGTQATLPILEDLGRTTFNFDYAYQTDQYPDVRNRPQLLIPAYGVANARLTFVTADNDWSLSAGVTNLFDKFYYYNRGFISGEFQIKANPAPPREWTLTLRKNF